MHIRNLAKKMEVDFVITDKWPLPVHKHTHYELQYILRGKGQHVINELAYPYEQGDVFILAPQDTHLFLFQQRSAICIIKFNEAFLSDALEDTDFKGVFGQLSARNKTAHHHKDIIHLMEMIIQQHREGTPNSQLVIRHALVLVLALAAGEGVKDTAVRDDKIQSILQYIDRHITDKPMLAIEKIADAFLISPAYFNQYFKRMTGSSYKKYVQAYALQLIAQQLTLQHKSLTQLADEFGYSDESHLSKAFKAHFNQSPSVFRKQKSAS